jgi:biopolymer transport protein ExbB
MYVTEREEPAMKRMWVVAVVGVACGLLSAATLNAQVEKTAPQKSARSAAVKPGSGSSLTTSDAMQNLVRMWNAGGGTMWWILFLSIISLAFVLERMFRLRRRAIVPNGFVEKADEMWRMKDYDGIIALCDRHRKSTLAKIVRFIVKHRGNPVGDINQVVGDIASRDIAHHIMLIYPLAASAVLSPLLGLFGTVIGMIEAFETVAVMGTMGDPSLLADSISKALITTAYGLIVAMPTLFFYNMFKFRTNYLSNVLEEQTTDLINDWLMKKE